MQIRGIWERATISSHEDLPFRDGRWFRVLTFDGGPNNPYYLHYLRKIVEKHPTFLSQVDLFAGTSNGTFAALFLASQEKERLRNHGREVVLELIAKNQQFMEAFSVFGGAQTVLGRLTNTIVKHGLRVFPGGKAVFKDETIHSVLTDIFGDKELDNIPGHALLVSFLLHPNEKYDAQSEQEREDLLEEHNFFWGPQIYHNLLPEPEKSNASGSRRLADMVMYSGSMPPLVAAHHCHVDGAVFANNPAMVAVSTVYALRHIFDLFEEDNSRIVRGLEDILVFSLGAADIFFVDPSSSKKDRDAVENAAAAPGALDWGIVQWMFRMQDPIRLVKLMFNADEHGVSSQCQSLLGSSNFCRMSVPPTHGSTTNMVDLLLGNSQEMFSLAEQEADAWVTQEQQINWWQQSPNMLVRVVKDLFRRPDKGSLSDHRIAHRQLSQDEHDIPLSDPFDSFVYRWLNTLKLLEENPDLPDDVIAGIDWSKRVEQPILYPKEKITQILQDAGQSEAASQQIMERFEFVFYPVLALSDMTHMILKQNWIRPENLAVLIPQFYELFDTGNTEHNIQMYNEVEAFFRFLFAKVQPGEELQYSHRSYVRVRTWLEFVWTLESPNGLSSHALWEILELGTLPSGRGDESDGRIRVEELFLRLIEMLQGVARCGSWDAYVEQESSREGETIFETLQG